MPEASTTLAQCQVPWSVATVYPSPSAATWTTRVPVCTGARVALA